MSKINPRRFNTQSSLTYNELSGIIDELENQFKNEMINTNSDEIGPYKVVRGKALALTELRYKLEDYMTTRHLDKTKEDGDVDEF